MEETETGIEIGGVKVEEGSSLLVAGDIEIEGVGFQPGVELTVIAIEESDIDGFILSIESGQEEYEWSEYMIEGHFESGQLFRGR